MANKRQISDEVILNALLTSRTKGEAAKQAGCDVRTIFERLKDFEFSAQLAALRADQLRANLEKAENAQCEAIDVVLSIMQSDESSAGDKLKAAQILLSFGTAARQAITAAESAAVGQLRNARHCEANRLGEIIFP